MCVWSRDLCECVCLCVNGEQHVFTNKISQMNTHTHTHQTLLHHVSVLSGVCVPHTGANLAVRGSELCVLEWIRAAGTSAPGDERETSSLKRQVRKPKDTLFKKNLPLFILALLFLSCLSPWL